MKRFLQLLVVGIVVGLSTGFACNSTPPPPPPTMHQANLSWNRGTPNVVGLVYNVYRSTGSGGPYTKVATDLISFTYADKTVTAGGTYYYVVTADSNQTICSATFICGESDYSNEVKTTIPLE